MNEKKVVIGLSGVKRSGKSTVANLIKDLIPNATEVALADKLKNVCSEVFRIDRTWFDRQDRKEVPFANPIKLTAAQILLVLKNFNMIVTTEDVGSELLKLEGTELNTPRKIAQIVGTEILRLAAGQDIHCKSINLSNDITIVSDIRFENEFLYFRNSQKLNFIPLYIDNKRAEIDVTFDSHRSEKEIFNFNGFCWRVDNNGSIVNTKKIVKDILKHSRMVELK